MGFFEILIMIVVFALLYLPPIYLGWRFFWKRGLKGWAWGTWAASLYGPVGFIVFGIGYLATRGIQQACPQCGASTRSGKTQTVTLQGEKIKEPIIAWLAIIGGGLLALGVLILILIALDEGSGLGGYCASLGFGAALGVSGVTWGFTQLNKARAKGNLVTTYQFKCLSCGHIWEHKIEPEDLSKVK